MSATDRIAASVPLAKPGLESFGITAPVMVQINPEGKWQSSQPNCLEEDSLRAVVAHLTKSQALSANQTYCSQCAIENKVKPNASNYVPVIVIPICSNDQCPFDIDAEIEKMKESEAQPKNKNAVKETHQVENDQQKSTKKKKRGFVMQRLNNNDLLSQW